MTRIQQRIRDRLTCNKRKDIFIKIYNKVRTMNRKREKKERERERERERQRERERERDRHFEKGRTGKN